MRITSVPKFAVPAFILLLVEGAATHSVETIAYIKTLANQLNDTYDYIIVGGGTSGLTVADRLTENSSTTVLVIEYGSLEPNPEILTPAIGLTNLPADMYNYTSIPQIGLNNQTAIMRAGALVGGGSAVNSMYFDRGSAEDYDNWEKLGNPGWGWEGLLPYFKKSVTFTPPSKEFQDRYNVTWNMDAYGDGPVHSSMPPFVWPTALLQWKGFQDFGIPTQREGADGHAYGLIWVPASMDPIKLTRSYARTAHYEPVSRRPNYHLLTGYHANKILFSTDLKAEGVEMQPRYGDPVISKVFAGKEVIIATGSIGTPLLLQRSGVGPKKLLKEAGIEVLVDLPGVGQNLQDHGFISVGYNFTTNPTPNKFQLNNATYFAEVMKEYHENKTGPITGADGCMGAFLPLTSITPNLTFLSPLSNLSPPPPSNSPVSLGLYTQHKFILASYLSPKAATIEVALTGAGGGAGTIFLKPLSRGSITINPQNITGKPIIDYGVLTNDIDMKILIESFRWSRRVYESSSMASLTPIETNPGPKVQSDADIAEWIRNNALPSAAHMVGTASMMPRELGGVVSPELEVWGTRGLRVVDASLFPLIPGTHLSATVYAVAEKAADIIKQACTK